MNNVLKLRLGLTMRVVDTADYYEPRDALAHDWLQFMKKTLPRALWVPVPNLSDSVIDFIESWRLNGFILTGGNNLFTAPARDETEMAILDYAHQNHLPVLGVCRGMQMICHYFGQDMSACPNRGHIAKNHKVHLVGNRMGWEEDTIIVNSFHDSHVGTLEDFTGQLVPFAVSSDGLVEGVWSQKDTMLGIMWHPERSNPSATFDRHLIGNFFC